MTAPREPAVRTGRSVAGGPVAVTGTGAVSRRGAGSGDPLEPGEDRAWGGLRELDVHRWYPVETNFGYMNRAAQLAAAAAAMAMDDAGLPVGGHPYATDRVAVVGGTHLGGGPQASGVLCRGLLENPDAIRPNMSLDHGLHLGAALVCRYFDLTGTTYTLTGSSVAGLQALAVLRDLLISGRADCGLGLGYDALDPLAERAFALLPDCPAARDLSEGGAALVLERQEAAAARGARCLALLGRPSLLSGRLTDSGSIRTAAERLARVVDEGWEVLYLAAPLDPRLDSLAEELLRAVGASARVVRTQDLLGHCLAGDGALCVAAAASRGAPALVLAAEPGGTIAALPVRPAE